MKKNVLITGGTGKLGKEIAAQLVSEACQPLVLTSKNDLVVPAGTTAVRGNLITGIGIIDAVSDVDVIIHCASDPRNSAEVDIKGTFNLLKAIPRERHPHVLYISICGVDKSSYLYYQNKRIAEKMIEGSGLPWSIIRITQFHDFFLDRILIPNIDGSGFLACIPGGLRFQSIDIKDAARYIVSVMYDQPKNASVTIGGPEILSAVEMAKTYFQLTGKKYVIEETVFDNDFYNIFQSGINLIPENKQGTITWEEFLRSRPA